MGHHAVREPNFFLVGASRAGTTSLWQYLIAHPDIYMPTRTMAEKEPSHFCEVTPKWALAYRERDRYLRLFEEAGRRRAVGEGSTPYLVAPEVPARIRSTYPDAKILIILRNPIHRAFSLYRFLCFIGVESITSFERALRAEATRMHDARFMHNNPVWYALYQYFHSGLYSSQIERYLEVFPRDQVKIILFDDLENEPVRTTQDVYRFLGVDASFVPVTNRHNASRFPLSVKVQYLLGHDLDRSAQGHLDPVRARLFWINVGLGRFRSRTLKAHTHRRLLDGYRDDIAKVSALINRPLDAWLTNREPAAS